MSSPYSRKTGSSPRERGTPRSTAIEQALIRFIPARAGNADGPARGITGARVHPRASGERSTEGKSKKTTAGSSPRERGTRPPSEPGSRGQRFIPARAGNATATTLARASQAVHPRASGERKGSERRGTRILGSSPRERGTHRIWLCVVPRARFIPARAGNATPAVSTRFDPPVHPRASGERAYGRLGGGDQRGSSPRERGTLFRAAGYPPHERFIPARAGNAMATGGSTTISTVHPRASGERTRDMGNAERAGGSSPRERGTRHW